MIESRGPWPHAPVLSQEVIEHLALEPGQVVVDATIGTGGHASEIADRMSGEGILIGLDRDPDALEIAARRLAEAVPRLELVHTSFAHLDSVLKDLGIDAVDRVLMDLGVSSLQLDTPGRGMSFQLDGPLDMRFDPTSGPTAADLLRRASERELAGWLRDYGEERYAGRISRALAQARQRKALPRTTGELAELVVLAVPRSARRQRLHPATRTFQALRIVVNGELEALGEGLVAASDALRRGGRLAVIAFHSLEDRRVKSFMRRSMDPLLKKPIRPGREERSRNPRSRSAKLRVAVRRTATSDPHSDNQEVMP